MFFENSAIDILARGSLLTAFAVVWVIVLIRLIGLRSLSKMTNFDFVTTLASGSLLASASQVTDWMSFSQHAIALAVIFFIQLSIALLRKVSVRFRYAVQNSPILLMRDGVIDLHALRVTRVARGDLIAKLREANVRKFSSVRAVVLETTGDIAVLHGDELDDEVLFGVYTLKRSPSRPA